MNQEDEFLLQNYKSKTSKEIARVLGRTKSSVINQLVKLNLKKGYTFSNKFKKNYVCWNKGKTGIKTSDKGYTPWNKGKTGLIKGDKNPFYGKKHSEKTIDLIKQARAKQITPTKDTSIEVKIQNFLKQLGIEFFTHQYIKIEHGYQCDIFIPSRNLVIECFGDYWHKIPYGNPLDSVRCRELREAGYRVLVLWEREIKVIELNDLKNKLK